MSTAKKTNKPRKPLIERFKEFSHDHPVIMNIVYIILTATVRVWLLLLFLDSWTRHGDEATVPPLKGTSIELAVMTLENDGFEWEIMDSVYETVREPGTVVEQTPCAGARVKPGRKVYLTIVAFSPKMVTVPDFMNISMRQGRSMFEGLGIEVSVVTVPSEYKDLVLGAKSGGVPLRPGQRIPVSSKVVLEVGGGLASDYEADMSDYDIETEDRSVGVTNTADADDETLNLLLQD
ncbi:MAG: PASTA domain-containing protein [Muribaculaceae bacterium]|nr:PASTA domain-containing protein [Muribaculaceae bacterium]